jgi:hypothetical protein
MGIPVHFAADDEPLLESALRAFAVWSATPTVEGGAALQISLAAGRDAGIERRSPEIHVEGPRLRLTGAGIDGEAFADRGVARCTVSPGLFVDPERLGAEVLDTLILFLLTRSGRIPVHAAGILIDETAVILAGPSGSGKSTLAFAASRDGIPVLSDDTVYLQLEPRFRIWGFPRPIHLLPDAYVPGSDGREPVDGVLRRRGGRWKIAAAPARTWTTAPAAERAIVCLLERGRAVAIRPIDGATAVDSLIGSLEPGFDHFRDQLPGALETLTSGGTWRLTLSSDAAEAVGVLRELVASIAFNGGPAHLRRGDYIG